MAYNPLCRWRSRQAIEVMVSRNPYREEQHETKLYTPLFRHGQCRKRVDFIATTISVCLQTCTYSQHTTAKDQVKLTAPGCEKDQMFDMKAINDPRELPPHLRPPENRKSMTEHVRTSNPCQKVENCDKNNRETRNQVKAAVLKLGWNWKAAIMRSSKWGSEASSLRRP